MLKPHDNKQLPKAQHSSTVVATPTGPPAFQHALAALAGASQQGASSTKCPVCMVRTHMCTACQVVNVSCMPDTTTTQVSTYHDNIQQANADHHPTRHCHLLWVVHESSTNSKGGYTRASTHSNQLRTTYLASFSTNTERWAACSDSCRPKRPTLQANKIQAAMSVVVVTLACSQHIIAEVQ